MGRGPHMSHPVSVEETSIHGQTPHVDEYRQIASAGAITTLFQPIVTLGTMSIFGYEALSRGPSDSPLHNPIVLFDAARHAGRLTELDLLCRRTGIQSFVSGQLEGRLFLNATPQSLLEPQHRSGLTLEALLECGLEADRVVIELTEQHPATDMQAMGKALDHYRSMGFNIAIDDLGAGYSSLRRWSELRPEFVKIDRHFVQDIDNDKSKRAFISSLATLAEGLQCQVIAEGVETEQEYRTLLEMGIRYGQGYFFARPSENPVRELDAALSTAPAKNRRRRSAGSRSIRDLLLVVPSVTPDRKLEDAYQLFMEDESLSAIAVVDEQDRPIGLLRRSRLLTTFSSQYGRSLHGHKSVLALVDGTAVRVEIAWDLEHISTLVTRNMQSQIEAEFLIEEQGIYLGLGKVVDLLRKVTETRIRNARHANPLTGLPGNVPIYEHLDDAIQQKDRITVAYFDLDNFKPFNDVYGYARGDAVIRLVAITLEEHLGQDGDFLGHVGGDDFIIVFRSQDWQMRCEQILTKFVQRVGEHYRSEDREQGGIFALSRDGEQRFFPMVTLSIGVIRPDMATVVSHGDIADMATRAKHNAKDIPGSSLYIERREHMPPG